MKKIVQIPRKNLHSDSFQDTMPASKRPKTGHSSNYSMEEDDEDPFGEDLITGEEFEEWERVATQAEIKLTQEQSDDKEVNDRGDFLEHNGGTNFKLPSCTTNSRGSKMSHDKNNFLINELQAKLKLYENKMKEMEQSYLRKDGETRVLRDRLTRAEKYLCEEKVKYSELQKQQLDSEKNQQKYIEKQVEKYKDQIEFKQAEIVESQNLIRNLEMKNKQLLENTSALNSTYSSKPSNSNFPGCSNWGSTQGGPSSAKKIKLVKPESPRVQSNLSLNNVTFTDDPLGRKKSKVIATTPSPSTEVIETKSTKDSICVESFKLKSKYISNGLNNHSVLQCLFGVKINTPSSAGKTSKVISPILHLLEPPSKDRCREISETVAIQGLTKLLHAPNQDLNSFDHLLHSDIPNLNSAIDVLPIIEKAISTYVSLQGQLSTFLPSQEESSFQTAVSKPEDLPPLITSSSLTPEKICSICERTLSAVKVLEVLSSHSRKLIDSIFQNFPGILKNLMLCACRKWNSGLFFTQSITACILSIIRILLEVESTEEHYQNFTPLMKAEIWVSLITCTDIPVRCFALDALIAHVHYNPFALVVIENQNPESSSLLCHICDTCCSSCPPDVPEEDWILLQKKNVAFLSLLAAKHESLLIEHSCFSEIYRAADVLLYNQLLRWKTSLSVDQSRDNLIHSAVCLLHSCANVYADGIPGSRRDHRHQVVLIELENFLNYNRDNESFWLQELNRIVKAEVKSVLEEQEAT